MPHSRPTRPGGEHRDGDRRTGGSIGAEQGSGDADETGSRLLAVVGEPTPVEWLFHDTSMVTDELVALRLAIYTQPGFLTAMTNIVAVQNWEYREPYAWSPEWCGRISAPTLLLWTDHDPTGTVQEAELLREWIPDARGQSPRVLGRDAARREG